MAKKCFCISGKIIALNLFGKRYSKKIIKKRDLKKYRLYLHPAIAVDGIIEKDNKILLIKRKNPPFKDSWAFPGGFVEYGETTENAVLREIYEETNLKTKIKHLLGVYSDPNRDPRGHTVSVVYILEPVEGTLKGSDDAKDAKLFKIEEVKNLDLAFDHKKIFEDYLEYSTKNSTKKYVIFQ